MLDDALYPSTLAATIIWLWLYFSSTFTLFRSRSIRHASGRIESTERVFDGESFHFQEQIVFMIGDQEVRFQQSVNLERPAGSRVQIFYPEGFPEHAKEGAFGPSLFSVFTVAVGALWFFSIGRALTDLIG